MSKPLIIVESPAKARTIQNFLGQKVSVKASMGHVRDLPKSQFGVDLEKGFEPKYINIRGKGEIIKDLREAARKASRVYLATDPDREGEAISWHLAKLLGLEDGQAHRVEIHEITRDVVQRALKNPREIDMNLVNAQQARRVLDRIVGYRLSPLLWKKVAPGLSAGRVQSVAVRLVCDREDEIARFVPQEYWTLTATLEKPNRDSTPFQAKYYGSFGEKREIGTGAEVEELKRVLCGAEYTVSSVKRKERRRSQPLPFTTSTLQQEASRKLGFTVKRTMRIAQQLYEGLPVGAEGTVGLISYIRTDSTRVGEGPRHEALAYIEERFGREFCNFGAGKLAEKAEQSEKPFVQGAHECIRPTSVRREPDAIKGFLTQEQYRLYHLIWERFVASQMTPAVYDTVTADIAAGDHIFRAVGSTLKFAGFTRVYVEGKDEDDREGDEALPELREGERLILLDLQGKQHFTQPPPRYTEAMLVKALEEKGIGRPSTYAPIIDTIQERGYVTKEDKRFKPTELGRVVVDLLKEHFPNIIDIEFTAEMEKELDRVESGEEDWQQVLRGFYEPFEKMLDRAETSIQQVEMPEEVSDVVCEACGRRMVVKRGRFGKFLACPGFPECRNTKPITESAGVRCPVCGADVVVRKSRKGRTFYGCSAYPRCTFVSWDKPLKKECPKCGAFLVEKRSRGKPKQVRCSREGCDYVDGEESSGA